MPRKPTQSPIHIADLQMVADALRADVDQLRDELAELAAIEAPTEAQVATRERTAGAWIALRGVLGENLEPMLAGWRNDEPQSRNGEIIANNEDGAVEVILATIHGRTVPVTIPESEN